MTDRIYFGHPINTYDTELEKELLAKIAEAFPGWYIENPNRPEHQEGYRRWKEMTGNGMDYYYTEVLPTYSIGIFLPFRDGAWGAGVFGEAEFLHRLGCPILEITREGTTRQVLNMDHLPVLSVEETRTRIRTETGNIRSY